VNRSLCVFALALLALIAASPSHADKRYVSDELRVSVRAGQGSDYRIVAVLPSGTEVETLEATGDWTRVRTPEGDTGWMRSQYLQAEPIAADRLTEVEAELQSARARVEELETALQRSQREAEAARERVAELESRNQTLSDKLARAQEGLELEQANQRLEARVDSLTDEVATLEQRNRELAERDRQRWFAVGAGVLAGGLLLGIIVARIPWRSRRSRLFE